MAARMLAFLQPFSIFIPDGSGLNIILGEAAMETLKTSASLEDVICAYELTCKYYDLTKSEHIIFDIYDIISIINFGCIKEEDKVIIMTPDYELITLLLSYLYRPKTLITLVCDTDCRTEDITWESMKELLSGYQNTDPVLSIPDEDNKDCGAECGNTVIAGTARPNSRPAEGTESRFYLDAGLEYEMYLKQFIKAVEFLKKEGILVILSKPGWVLKTWELIDALGLQLEYDNYRLYGDAKRQPNAYVWLRFVKKESAVDHGLHKKNIISLMTENGIDRLFAHRNKERFPYTELSYLNSEPYVKLDADLDHMQYFFSAETTVKLADLCEGYTACLVTPSVAQCAYKANKNIVLFERDNRFRENGGLKFVKYDLDTGLTKLLHKKYEHKFNRIICDPPFDINPGVLAADIAELIRQESGSTAYVVFPAKRKAGLVNAMKAAGLIYREDNTGICVEYAKPPKLVRVNGKAAIGLYEFVPADNR